MSQPSIRRSTGPIRSELARLGHRPRKRFGQHFLADAGLARRIVDLAGLTGSERVVEIGPGLGALTDLLAAGAGELWLIEIDRDLAACLRERYAGRSRVHVVDCDALAIDYEALLGAGARVIVVANLPYNIATAVLATLLGRPHLFGRMVLMLQREVVERLDARPGSKDYGALSVLTQVAARVRPALRVGPEAFVPRPKVDSEVVVIEPHATAPVAITDPAAFRHLVRTVFNQRRKQLINSLRPACRDPLALLQRAGIDPSRRPETLQLDEFAALANALGEPSS